ncbi:uridine diphosphate-N-acetylglucosamine-binding protein YvcK [Fusobacterium sp. FSA-380-WT-3A]|uniref:gluconeogenesis factor YvcK family protein n=1 Tax=Fusobacterium sp. FSA-380-WT-3A TaxID=2725304 RepID=UPI00147685BC|nr:uridine diphosphate-N-acetylglucosamine-binding protein YvcK [Fusobacterium sp. FSA-380-WT-3A]NME36544.1 uridine diphosphate-N-acetylglucosamine-binding protein YvcK [Fusobacterium sp. FSA-380-WT-3A]
MNKKPKVVVIGGGSGISVVLRGLKYLPIELTAIVSVADDGGSSGTLRKEFDSPPPGDLRNVLIALSDVEPIIEDVFQYRFNENTSIGAHPLGNLLIMAMNEITGNIGEAVDRLRKLFNIKAKILPSTIENIVLYAETENGKIIEGESNIPYSNEKIKKVFYKKKRKAPIKNLQVLEEADLIVFGIGSLYTSLIPNLLLEGVKESLEKTKGKIVYICNAMQQPGETTGYSADDHIQAICDVIGDNIIDEIVVDTREISEEILKRYKKQNSARVIVEEEKIKKRNIEIIDRDILEIDSKGMIRHHPYKLSATLYSLIDKWEEFYK